MFVKKARCWHGRYIDGEYDTSAWEIEASGETLEELDAEVRRLTKENTSEGSTIDFGYRSGQKGIDWEPEVYEKKLVHPRKKEFMEVVTIQRKHKITLKYNKAKHRTRPWSATCEGVTVRASDQVRAKEKLINKLTNTHVIT